MRQTEDLAETRGEANVLGKRRIKVSSGIVLKKQALAKVTNHPPSKIGRHNKGIGTWERKTSERRAAGTDQPWESVKPTQNT